MSNAARPSPVRTCVGCRRRRAAAELLRVTMSADGAEVDGASRGRGAWLCRATASPARADGPCLEQALSRRAFDRAWRRTLGQPDVQVLRELLARDEDEHPDAH